MKYNVIYADPPWQQKAGRPLSGDDTKNGTVFNPASNTSADLPYPTMTVDEIKALPIKDIAAGLDNDKPVCDGGREATMTFTEEAGPVPDFKAHPEGMKFGSEVEVKTFEAPVSAAEGFTKELEHDLGGVLKKVMDWNSAVYRNNNPISFDPTDEAIKNARKKKDDDVNDDMGDAIGPDKSKPQYKPVEKLEIGPGVLEWIKKWYLEKKIPENKYSNEFIEEKLEDYFICFEALEFINPNSASGFWESVVNHAKILKGNRNPSMDPIRLSIWWQNTGYYVAKGIRKSL